MKRRTIISELERNNILGLHDSYKNRLNEQVSTCQGKVKEIINLSDPGNKDGYLPPNGKLTTLRTEGGSVVLNPKTDNLKITPDMVIKIDDTIQMKEGSKLSFKDIKGYGQGEFICKDNKITYYLYWD